MPKRTVNTPLQAKVPLLHAFFSLIFLKIASSTLSLPLPCREVKMAEGEETNLEMCVDIRLALGPLHSTRTEETDECIARKMNS